MRKTKSIRQFIQDHRKELDDFIENPRTNVPRPTNDEERRLWVLNDEGLYNWARSEGVPI